MKYLVLCFLFAGISASAFAMTKAEAKAIYDTDTKKVNSGDLAFDWKEFRLAAVLALKSANEIIDHNMAEPEGHLLALVAFQKLGQTEDASFQHKVVDAYVASILASGDGKSSKTAFFVVDVSEEYFYLNIILGIGLPASQSLVTVDGHSFDMLKIKDKDGKDQEVWFNVDTSMGTMRDAIAGKK
jgi:hypothetical protein